MSSHLGGAVLAFADTVILFVNEVIPAGKASEAIKATEDIPVGHSVRCGKWLLKKRLWAEKERRTF